jgi:DNA-binding NarL/FixJ family response regulator
MTGDPRTVRILVADDHQFVREGLISVLEESHPEWQVVGEAANGRQAIELSDALRPDVAVLDLSMPEIDGLKVMEHLCASIQGIRVLMLSVHAAHPVMRQIRRGGASAFLSKSEAPRQLVTALERVLAGEPFFASEAASRPASPLESSARVPVQFLLTPREMDVLRLLARGRCNKEIASELNLSVRTAESHRANIMNRLGLDSLAQLVSLAVRDGVI